MKSGALSIFFASTVSLAVSNSASAGCWNECALTNPITGSCVQKVKICDVTNPGRAAASFEVAIRSGAEGLVREWHSIWGAVPDHLRKVLEDYPLTFASAIFPETRAYTMAMAAIENFYNRAKRRSRQIDEVLGGEPAWKKSIATAGLSIVLLQENRDMKTENYDALTYDPEGDTFDAPYGTFLGCVKSSPDHGAAKKCLDDLEWDIAVAKRNARS